MIIESNSEVYTITTIRRDDGRRKETSRARSERSTVISVNAVSQAAIRPFSSYTIFVLVLFMVYNIYDSDIRRAFKTIDASRQLDDN